MGAVCCTDSASVSGGHAIDSRGGGKRLGGDGGGNGGNGVSAQERRKKAAEAAERRAKTGGGNVGGISGQDMTSVKERQERDRLIGKIEAMYQASNKDPPFGLRAATLPALKKHLKTAQQLSAR